MLPRYADGQAGAFTLKGYSVLRGRLDAAHGQRAATSALQRAVSAGHQLAPTLLGVLLWRPEFGRLP